jgi:hypothetical protein
MKYSVDELVNIVVAAVLAELSRRGVEVDFSPAKEKPVSAASAPKTSTHLIDMSGYRSPVLLEHHLLSLPSDVKEIAVPERTVITPGAREILRKKNITLKNIPKTN